MSSTHAFNSLNGCIKVTRHLFISLKTIHIYLLRSVTYLIFAIATQLITLDTTIYNIPHPLILIHKP